MKKTSLLLWLLGYFTLEMPRAYCEDFLNLCLRYGFDYYGLCVDEENKRVTVNIASGKLKRVLSACKVWQIRVRVVSRHGFFEHILRYRGRWGIAVGAMLSLAIFFAAQSVIWRIDVVGNERLTSEQIIESLAENGMKIGDRISEINTDSVEQRVMINDDGIAWISVNITGTVARVEVREVIDTDVKEKDTKPANIVSLYDAQIVALEVYSGSLCVKEGDFVRAGELLVSGVYKSEKAPLRYTRANARVLARVTRSFEVEIPLVQSKKVPTGEKFEQKTLIFFGKSIKVLPNYRNLPSTCDIINYVYTLDPFSLGELPIALKVDTYLPYTWEQIEIGEDEAIEQAYTSLRELIDAEMPEAQILKKTLYGEFVDGKYVLKCNITAICNIARQIEFEVLPKN